MYAAKAVFSGSTRTLCCEVLSRGHTAEFSHMEDLVSTAQTVEDAVCYNMGTQQTKGQGGNHVAPQRLVLMGVRSTAVPRLATDTELWPRTTLNHSSTYLPQTKSSVPKSPRQCQDQSYQDD